MNAFDRLLFNVEDAFSWTKKLSITAIAVGVFFILPSGWFFSLIISVIVWFCIAAYFSYQINEEFESRYSVATYAPLTWHALKFAKEKLEKIDLDALPEEKHTQAEIYLTLCDDIEKVVGSNMKTAPQPHVPMSQNWQYCPESVEAAAWPP